MSNYLNRTAKLAYFTARKQEGDVSTIANTSGYSYGHVRRMLNGERRINDDVADDAYYVTYNRRKNSELMNQY
jgi:hypothetical protein